jgi:hypothetical protein
MGIVRGTRDVSTRRTHFDSIPLQRLLLCVAPHLRAASPSLSHLADAHAAGACGLALLLALGGLGCGRKATVEDCQQIVKRIVELELESVVPEQDLGSEVRDVQQALRDRAQADCVGRRITEKSLACVAAAKSAEHVIDECFD